VFAPFLRLPPEALGLAAAPLESGQHPFPRVAQDSQERNPTPKLTTQLIQVPSTGLNRDKYTTFLQKVFHNVLAIFPQQGKEMGPGSLFEKAGTGVLAKKIGKTRVWAFAITLVQVEVVTKQVFGPAALLSSIPCKNLPNDVVDGLFKVRGLWDRIKDGACLYLRFLGSRMPSLIHPPA
jgi:hypothetical protein